MLLTARQQRILTTLALGDLLWEVPGQEYFTQYNERTGRQTRVHIRILEEIANLDLICLEKQDAHQLNYWTITQAGRKLIADLQPRHKRPELNPGRQKFHIAKKIA